MFSAAVSKLTDIRHHARVCIYIYLLVSILCSALLLLSSFFFSVKVVKLFLLCSAFNVFYKSCMSLLLQPNMHVSMDRQLALLLQPHSKQDQLLTFWRHMFKGAEISQIWDIIHPFYQRNTEMMLQHTAKLTKKHRMWQSELSLKYPNRKLFCHLQWWSLHC